MKALTIWQPWASLICWGVKPYEFRGWRAHAAIQGKRIAIHAAARKIKTAEVDDLIDRLRSDDAWTTCLKPEALELLEKARKDLSLLPLSHVLCTAKLGKPVVSPEIVGEFGGVINDSDRNNHCNFAWPMLDVKPLVPPEPANGFQGFWNWKGA